MYHGFKDSSGLVNSGENNPSAHTRGLFFITQNAFDNLFETLINKENIDSHNIPFWLMELYNEFIRIIENKNLNEKNKLKVVLGISKNLYIQSYMNLGISSTKNIFKNNKN